MTKRAVLNPQRTVTVVCLSCGWSQTSSNAQGLAAIHADHHPGHKVRVSVVASLIYVGG